MPLLDEKIFIHIPKCGGTSIEKAYGINTSNLKPNYKVYFGREINKASPYKHKEGIGYILQHLTSNELKERLGLKYIFENTFTIVRDPLTRYISELNWRKIDIKNINNKPFYTNLFTTSFHSMKHQHHLQMHEFIYHGDVKLVKNIFHNEKIQEAFHYIKKKEIISNRSNHNITANSLSEKHLHSVYDTFFMDYNLFGYLTDNIIQYYINKIKGTDLIITFIDSTYLPIFNIFYTYFERFNLKNLLVISLDDKVFLNLSKRKIFTLLIKYKIVKKNSFWDFRYNIINKLFQLSKKNIIHTDSDCIWLKNITKNPQLSLKYDIIGQMAFGVPKNVVNKIGMVLCCGFYKIFYSDKTCDLFNEISRKKYNNNVVNDQIRMNNYILHEYEKITENEFGKCITIRNTDIKILLLNESYISRNTKYSNVFLFHPILLGTMEEKELKLKKKLKIIQDYPHNT